MARSARNSSRKDLLRAALPGLASSSGPRLGRPPSQSLPLCLCLGLRGRLGSSTELFETPEESEAKPHPVSGGPAPSSPPDAPPSPPPCPRGAPP